MPPNKKPRNVIRTYPVRAMLDVRRETRDEGCIAPAPGAVSTSSTSNYVFW